MALLSAKKPNLLKRKELNDMNLKKNRKFIILGAVALVLLIVGLVLILCRGISNDPNVAKEELVENGYWAELYSKGPDVETWKNAYGVDVDGLEHVILAFPELDENEKVVTDEYVAEDVVYIFYFEDKAAAKDAYDTIEKFMNDFAEANESSQEFKISRSGAKIWFGTKAAIKAAK